MKQTRSAMQGGLVAAAALALIVGTVGLPLPTGRPKDRSIAFPCMDRPCGCHDAADCKAHCCCFSSDEKLAWAAEHGVDAEPFVDRAGSGNLPDEAPHSRLLSEAENSCCEKHVASCCSPAGNHADGHRAVSNLQKPDCGQTASDQFVSISAFRQCNVGFLWSVLSAALAPPEPLVYEFEWLLTGHVLQQNAKTISLSFSPPTPPPRA